MVAIDGPTYKFRDNNRPESVLQKKHNSIAYHKVCESVAAKALRVKHEPGTSNLADVLTKWLPAYNYMSCCMRMMW